jgi:hypothetical protein
MLSRCIYEIRSCGKRWRRVGTSLRSRTVSRNGAPKYSSRTAEDHVPSACSSASSAGHISPGKSSRHAHSLYINALWVHEPIPPAIAANATSIAQNFCDGVSTRRTSSNSSSRVRYSLRADADRPRLIFCKRLQLSRTITTCTRTRGRPCPQAPQPPGAGKLEAPSFLWEAGL